MTENCELCGRGMNNRYITPEWWPYDTVCQRKRCEYAVRDALKAIEESRENNVAQKIAGRKREQSAPYGYRTDSMARIQFEQEWWATEIAKGSV